MAYAGHLKPPRGCAPFGPLRLSEAPPTPHSSCVRSLLINQTDLGLCSHEGDGPSHWVSPSTFVTRVIQLSTTPQWSAPALILLIVQTILSFKGTLLAPLDQSPPICLLTPDSTPGTTAARVPVRHSAREHRDGPRNGEEPNGLLAWKPNGKADQTHQILDLASSLSSAGWMWFFGHSMHMSTT